MRLRIVFLMAFVCLGGLALAEDLRIPVMIGQTGASASFGTVELDAYILAKEEWNARGGLGGRQIVLDIQDTKTEQREIVSAFQFLAMKQPPVILGPTWLDTYQAVIPMARRQEILLVTPSAASEAFSEDNRKWAVTFYHNTTIEMQFLAGSLREAGHKRVALFYEQDPFAEMARKLFVRHLPEMVAETGIQGGEADFHAVLKRLKAQKPDVLVLFVWNERSLLSLLQQIRIYMPELPLATMHDGDGWLKNPAFAPLLPRLSYVRFVSADTSFDLRFEKRFGYQPVLTAAPAYDALNAVLKSMAAGNKTATEIRRFITDEELDTVTFGKFRFSDYKDGGPSKLSLVEHRS